MKYPPELLSDVESGISVFEEAVARAEKLGKAAREAAEASTRTSQEALRKKEEK